MVDQFPHLLRLGFMAASVVWTLEGWSADLVESRRRFRVVFLIVQGLLIFTVVILENFIPLTLLSEELCLLMSSLMIFVAAMLLAVFFLQAKPELSQQITVSVETSSNSREKNTTQIPKPNSVNDDSINRVKTFLNNGTWYKQTDLTIGHLASQLSMPEYKLRQLVNKQMGYRNFNVLLNKYRIGAACEMLKDEQFNNLPILNIALEVGFRSLSTFNKAFKELLETTPSEYRKSKSL
jgi:AraC-like DNA-binding protein